MKNKKMLLPAFLLLPICLFSLFSGCGKKGPPLPPEIKGNVISAPFDLKHTLNQNIITLSWNHEIDKETAVIKPKEFEIHMAEKRYKDCAGCPFKFNKIGSVLMPSKEFVFKLQKGIKYYFRIQAVGEGNIKSGYSKTIQVEN